MQTTTKERKLEMKLQRIDYRELSSKAKENYNFHQVAALLAGFGFNSIRMTDDSMGADFLAPHIDGNTVLKVQLKSRLTVSKKYVGKEIWIAFPHNGDWFMFPHDEGMEYFLSQGRGNEFSTGHLSAAQIEFLQPYKLNDRQGQ
jgi:hypothetical protein